MKNFVEWFEEVHGHTPRTSEILDEDYTAEYAQYVEDQEEDGEDD